MHCVLLLLMWIMWTLLLRVLLMLLLMWVGHCMRWWLLLGWLLLLMLLLLHAHVAGCLKCSGRTSDTTQVRRVQIIWICSGHSAGIGHITVGRAVCWATAGAVRIVHIWMHWTFVVFGLDAGDRTEFRFDNWHCVARHTWIRRRARAVAECVVAGGIIIIIIVVAAGRDVSTIVINAADVVVVQVLIRGNF